MEYYVLNDYREEPPKKLNHKKVIKLIIFLTTVITLIVLFSLYIGNSEFRGWTDKYIFRKEITENTGSIIEVDTGSNSYIYAYDRYVVVLNRNHLQNYNSIGNKESEIELTITNPIFSSNGRYLCVAERGGNKVYLISGEHIIWQKDTEGEISQVYVNKNGYVAVNHKTVVKLFNTDGKDIATAYLSSTYAIDTAVSNDNSELAIAEINYSGSLIQSSVKIISVDKVQTDSDNAIIYTYKAEKKSIITGIHYQDGNTLICMFDGKIIKGREEIFSEETKFDSDTLFADINLSGYTVEIRKTKAGIFGSEAQVEIKQVSNGKINIYTTNLIPKEIKTYENVIALNLGTEVHFIDTNGWLIKKYTSTRNVKDIVVCGNLAGILYKDRIELLSL